PDRSDVCAKTAPPELLAQERDAVVADSVLIRQEYSAVERRDAQQREQVGGHARAEHALGFAVTGDDEPPRATGGNAVERPVQVAPIEEVRRGDRRARRVLAHTRHTLAHIELRDRYELLRVAIGQRPSQDS